MDTKDFETFDFLINDEDEVMLLLYQRDGEPSDPHIELDSEENDEEAQIVHAYEAEIRD